MPPPWRPGVGETLKFTPGPNHDVKRKVLEPAFDRTPRYLFRVYDDTSSGTTNADCVSSRVADLGSPESRRNMLDQTSKEAAKALNLHLNWRRSHQDGDNLVSWSCSLLFTLQYALYRHHKRGKKHPERNVRIIMIDTTLFPKGTFVPDIEVMYCLRNRSSGVKQLYELRTGQRGTAYPFGEYLSQGCINVSGASGVTSLKKLIDTGLFNEFVCPYLEDTVHWSSLAKRVLRLREEVKTLKAKHQERAPIKHARAFIAIAEACFGSHKAHCNLAPAFAVMLLSLSRFSGWENDSVDAFLNLYPEVPSALRDMSTGHHDNLYEVEALRMAAEAVIRHYIRTKSLEIHFQRAVDDWFLQAKPRLKSHKTRKKYVDGVEKMIKKLPLEEICEMLDKGNGVKLHAT